MKSLNLKSIEVVCHECSISHHDLLNLIVKEWIVPADSDRHYFDEEDIARIRLINELVNDLEVGEAAIPIILNLLDQLHVLRKLAKN